MKSCNNNKNKATTNGKATYRHLNQAFSLNGGQSGALEWLIALRSYFLFLHDFTNFIYSKPESL